MFIMTMEDVLNYCNVMYAGANLYQQVLKHFLKSVKRVLVKGLHVILGRCFKHIIYLTTTH